MAYNTTQTGNELTGIPYFSSPDLSYQGSPLGTTDATTPENNALSMKQVKRSVSYYRSTVVDAPAAEVSDDEIEVVMNREENLTISVNLSNTGDSPLVYDADFRFPRNRVDKGKRYDRSKLSSREPLAAVEFTRYPYNYSGMFGKQKQQLNEEVIYSTSFESSEGFTTGSFGGRNEWRAITDTEFNISSSNSSSGSQHLRFSYDNGETHAVSSPFFGYQTLGTYEVSVDFEVSHPDQESYDFYIYDGKTGGFSAGVIIDGGSIFFADRSETGGITFLGGIHSINENQYHNLRIVFDADEEIINYFLDGNSVYDADYIQGYNPGVLRILNANNQAGSFIDVDDVEIKKVNAPYAWLDLPKMNGVVEAGGSQDVQLSFTTEGINAGEYETHLLLRTNQPGNVQIEIPLRLTVNDAVSNEVEEIPSSITLHQNYPNPFNPVTSIQYELEQPQQVQLEVFNMQGRKVAEIQNQAMAAGKHTVHFDASNLSSGVYMYRLKAGNKMMSRQMVLIK